MPIMFCCGGKKVKNDVVSDSKLVPVYLNVYDLTSNNDYIYWAGFGIFHSGVEVHNVEYAFGAYESPLSGIFETEPKQSQVFSLRKSILIGKTKLGHEEVKDLMKKLGNEYRGDAYQLLTKNCNHFSNDVCLKLTGKRIPRWVNRIARIGLMFNCMLPNALKSAKVSDHTIKDKQVVVS